MNISDRKTHLFRVIKSSGFLHQQGLGNELPLFICPYEPHDTVAFEEEILELMEDLETQGVRVMNVNLYDMALDILRKASLLDAFLSIESRKSPEQVKEFLQASLDPERHLIPAIRSRAEETPHDVIFLTGAGSLHPWLRISSILRNLHSAVRKPLIMFYPGCYEVTNDGGAALLPFGCLADDRYYRAFNIFDFQSDTAF